MKNKEFDDYYATVLAAAFMNVEFIELTGQPVNDNIVANSGAKSGFNKIAFLQDVKAFTKVIVDRREAVTKFDSINVEAKY